MTAKMKINRAVVGVYVFTLVSGGVALADCPRSMPTQLLEDCLIYDSEGETFPADDYAHMDEYQAWIKTQAPESQPSHPNIASTMSLRKPGNLSAIQP